MIARVLNRPTIAFSHIPIPFDRRTMHRGGDRLRRVTHADKDEGVFGDWP